MGPIIKLSCTLSSISTSRDSLRHGYTQDRARSGHQSIGNHSAVGIAQEPGEQWVAQVFGGEQVEPVALLNGMLRHRGIIRGAGLRHETAREVRDGLPIGRGVRKG